MNGFEWLLIFPSFDGVLLLLSAIMLTVSTFSVSAQRLAIIGHVAILLMFTQRNGPALFGGELVKPENSNQLKVLMLNVKQFENDPESELRIVELIQSENPDIVCLQEFGLYYKWPDVASVSAHFAQQVSLPFYDFSPHKGNIFGTAIFSRFEIVEIDTVFQPISYTNEAKIYTIRWGVDTLKLANVHLQSFNFSNTNGSDALTVNQVIRLQADQIELLINLLKASNVNLICGDFNSPAGSFFYQQLTALPYSDVQKESALGWKSTHQVVPSRIDFMMRDSTIRTTSFNLSNCNSSDHRAMISTFVRAAEVAN